MKKKESVLQVIKETVRKHGVLSAGLFAAVCGAVVFALLPPLILAQLIDRLDQESHPLDGRNSAVFRTARPDWSSGVGKGESSDGIRPENYACTPEQSDGKVRTPFCQ